MSSKLDRFTNRAKQALALAQEEAHLLGHNYIGTEHLLLGLIREETGLAAQVLDRLGITAAEVRTAIENTIGKGQYRSQGKVELSPRTKRVIELAVDEARRLGHHYIGTEHLLLGLVREGGGIAAGILEGLGVSGISGARRVFTATLSPRAISELSEQPWLRYLRLSRRLRLLDEG